MLKTRVIPTLLWKGLTLVKGVAFDSWRRVGTVLPAIMVYNKREVDELILLDILASNTGEEPDYESVKEFSSECLVPLTVGGGINCVEHVQSLLNAGADKISINSSAYSNPDLIDKIANRFGSQCVVASIDVRFLSEDYWRCYSHSGTRDTGQSAIKWARELELRGAGEILITSIDRDGARKGYDLKLIEAIVNSVKIPVIASGGAGNYTDLVDAVTKAGASAVSASSIFHFTEQTPLGAKEALAAHGVPVRKIYLHHDRSNIDF